MWFYWSMFAVPALASMSPARLTRQSRSIVVIATAILLIVIIGLRDHVGADWGGYEAILKNSEAKSFLELVTVKEPAFGLINWINIQTGWGVPGINLFCSVIFVSGFISFLNRQSNFWRCLALAVPVLIIQLAMSGIRQAAAMGILFFALNAFVDRKPIKYFVLVLVASTLHETALIFMLLGIFMYGRVNVIVSIAVGSILLVLMYFVARDAEYYQISYISQDAGAAGVIPRVALNAISVLIFWRYRKSHFSAYPDYVLLSVMAVATCIVTPFAPFFQVAVDRVEYYLIPFQITVVSRASDFMSPRIRMAFLSVVFAGYAAVLVVWMNYSWIAQLAWLPYQSVLWTGGN